MTRVPKFRAWDKDNKKMYDQNSIVFIDYEHGLGVQKLYYEGSIAVERDIDTFGFVCIDLMQSTGLKDKNGTEIYEGDILKLDGLAGLFEVRRANSGLYKLFRRSTPYDLIKLIDWIGYVEVIGNVYENKELLE